jgi:general secretion pathway protein G
MRNVRRETGDGRREWRRVARVASGSCPDARSASPPPEVRREARAARSAGHEKRRSVAHSRLPSPVSRLTRIANADRGTFSLAGFTLLELIVVIIVLGLLAGLVAPQIFGRLSEAKGTTAKTQMALIGTALDNFRLDNGTYPTTAQGLAALRVAPTIAPAALNWKGPYLRKEVPLDPWKRAYLYEYPVTDSGDGYGLKTLGRDGKPGGTGEDEDLVGQ